MTTISVSNVSEGNRPPSSGKLPGKKPDGNPYDDIYLKGYFAKFLFSRLYGQESRGIKFPGLVSAINTFSSGYKLSNLPSEAITFTCLQILLNKEQKPETQLERDMVVVAGDMKLIEAAANDPSQMFEAFLRKFMVQTLGEDLRVPDPNTFFSGGGYRVHIKPVSAYNEQNLIKKLKTHEEESSDHALVIAFNRELKAKLDKMFLSLAV